MIRLRSLAALAALTLAPVVTGCSVAEESDESGAGSSASSSADVVSSSTPAKVGDRVMVGWATTDLRFANVRSQALPDSAAVGQAETGTVFTVRDVTQSRVQDKVSYFYEVYFDTTAKAECSAQQIAKRDFEKATSTCKVGHVWMGATVDPSAPEAYCRVPAEGTRVGLSSYVGEPSAAAVYTETVALTNGCATVSHDAGDALWKKVGTLTANQRLLATIVFVDAAGENLAGGACGFAVTAPAARTIEVKPGHHPTTGACLGQQVTRALVQYFVTNL